MKEEIKAGRWYLCAICKSCKAPIPLFWILPNAPMGGDGDFVFRDVPCQSCGEVGHYSIREAQRIQAQPEGPPPPTRH